MQTKSYAADNTDLVDRIHTKNNMSPNPSEGGHKYFKTLRIGLIGHATDQAIMPNLLFK